MIGTAYLFPGQGSQKVGMGRSLCADFPEAQRLFQEADEILGRSLSSLCFDGPAEALTDTANAQPALLVTSLAMLEAARAQGAPEPNFVAGHSLGHITALVAAGAMDFAPALRLVQARGQAMKAAAAHRRGGMAAVIQLDRERLAEVCERAGREAGGCVGIANDNAPGQIVISGEERALGAAMRLAKEAGARRIIPLAVSVASHSPLMAGAAERLAPALEEIEIRPPRVPVVSNVTARPLERVDDVRRDIVQQLTRPVHWTDSIQHIVSAGVGVFVEIGPGNVLTGLVRRIAPAVQAWSLDDDQGLERLLAAGRA